MKTVSAVELDAIDRKMLRVLQQDGRITNAELAKQVALSESACLRRLRALEAASAPQRSALDALQAEFDSTLAALRSADAGARLRAVMDAPVALRGKVKAGASH